MSYFIKIAFIILLLNLAVNGQTSATVEVDVNDRVKQLEAQVLAMQAELEKLKQTINKNSPAESQIAAEKMPEVKTAEVKSEAPKKDEKKSLGIDVGNVRITLYGIIYFNAFGNSGGTNNSDVPLWATVGRGNVSASGRQTRLGVKIDGGKIGNAAVNGVVEADFYGGFPAVGIGENFGVVRIRLANVRLNWEKTAVVIGQDWMLFAPNSPQSLAAAAIPQFAAAGNPWARLPQIRIEQKLGKNFLWQGALLAPQTGDFPSGTTAPALLQPGSGAASRVPFIQSRLSFTGQNWLGTKKSGTVGISGHYGRSSVTVGTSLNDIDSVGLAIDWNFPLAKRVSLTGEAFVGRNLGGFQAGIFQGYNTEFAFRQNNTLVTGGVRSIGTRGGWTQLGWNLPLFQDRLTAFASIGIDDPRNADLVTISNRNLRTRNLAYAFDLIYKLTPQLSFGGEFRRFNTSYSFDDVRRSNHINLSGTYSF